MRTCGDPKGSWSFVASWVTLVIGGGGEEDAVANSSIYILDCLCGFRCWSSGAAGHYRGGRSR